MTVASTTSKSGPYNGNGVTVNFAVSFKYTATADVDVIVTSAAGVETTKTVTTHYTITAAGDSGTVTFLVAPASGETVTIVRTMPMIQDMDLTTGGGLSANTVEANADTQLMQIQEIAERVSRAPKLRQTTAAGPLTFPEPVANGIVKYNAGATDLEIGLAVDIDLATVSPFILTLLDDPDAATARTTLGAQTLDADLTAIAALTTVAYGRSLLTLANATALAAEVDSFFLTPAEGNAAYQPLSAALTAYPDPTANDADALGTPTASWSDLFLASGGVIGWNNGDVTITHNANALAFAGATNGYSFDDDITQTRVGGIWTDEPSYNPFTITVTIASSAVVTWTAHGRVAGNVVTFATTGALPTGMVAATKYFVIASGLTANAFQFSTTLGGAAVNTSGGQSGVHRGYIQGVNIARFERVLIADAVDNTGVFPAVPGSTWMDTYDPFIVGISDLAVVSRSGMSAILAAVRSSDRDTGPANAIAGSFYAVNDNTTTAQVAFGIYIEATRPVGGGTIHCMEMDATEFGTANTVRPYTTSYAGVSSGLWVASGGGNEVGTTDASIAINILNNNSKWKTGISFDADGLTGTDGVTGTGEAIALARGHQLNWYYAGNNIGFQIWSDVDASADAQILHVDTNGTKIVGEGGEWNFRIAKVSGTVTGNLAVESSTSANPILRSEGSATNIDISIRPKGTGVINLDGGMIQSGFGISTGDVGFELGNDRTGDGNAYIDFHATSGSDFEARVFRTGGANGSFQFTNNGTGTIQFNANNASGLLQFIVNSVDKLRVDSAGPITQVGTATPAAASAIPMIRAGSSSIGIYTGSGDPNAALTAAQGSIYLRTNGGASTRIYSNNNGGTGWSAVTSA